MAKGRNELLAIIADRLQKARKLSRLGREKVAEESDVDADTVLRWEKAENEPGIANLYRIAQVYAVSVDWLIGEDKALDPEEMEVIEVMRDRDEPFQRGYILAAARARRPELSHQSQPLRRVAEGQADYQEPAGQ